MPRRFLFLSLLTLLLLAPASAAWARGDGWEPVNNQPATLEACGTTVTITFPMDKEYQRVTTDAQGNQHIKVTGALKATFTDTATGRSVTYNVSGPGNSIAYANGDFLFNATGRNFIALFPNQVIAGLPQIFVTSGPIRVLFRVASRWWWKSADAGSRWPILCGGDDSLGDHLLDRMWVEELAA
jgi:hypothetical protein